MKREEQIVRAVAELSSWVDSQIAESGQSCDACGKCCDFDGFDHRLFVTTPELVYFISVISPEGIKPMPTGTCPYNAGGSCCVYDRRFVACRIFSCKGDSDLQGRLSEQASERLKAICRKFGVNYQYMDIKAALNGFCEGCESISGLIGFDYSAGRG